MRVLDADERHRGLMMHGGLTGPAHIAGVHHAVLIIQQAVNWIPAFIAAAPNS